MSEKKAWGVPVVGSCHCVPSLSPFPQDGITPCKSIEWDAVSPPLWLPTSPPGCTPFLAPTGQFVKILPAVHVAFVHFLVPVLYVNKKWAWGPAVKDPAVIFLSLWRVAKP